MGLTNQLKSRLPWVCVAALVAGMLALWTRGKATERELAALRESNNELQKARVEDEDLKKLQAQVEELGRLRKENDELHRLRNEVRQLREEKQGTARAVRSGPSSQSGGSPAAQPETVQLQQQLHQLMAENERLRAENEQIQQLQVNAANPCINNLRILEGAKDQWALENKKTTGSAMNAEDLQPYLKNGVLPMCPQGGVYTLNAVGAMATCSIPGHVLPPQ